MKKIYLLFLLVLVNFTVITSYAQSKKKAADSTVVIIFNESGTSNSAPKKKNASSQKNIIKIAPLGFIFGHFPLLYERQITNYFTVQGGVGLTHRNYLRTAFLEISDRGSTNNIIYPWGNDNYDDKVDGIYQFEKRRVKLGYMASLQPRAYFGDEAPDGGFIGLSFDYYRFNFEIPGAIYDAQQATVRMIGANKQEYENFTDIMVQYGGQRLYDRLSLEYTLGLGLRNIKGAKYAAALLPNNTISDGLAKYKSTGVNWFVGLKVGYHF